MASELHLEIAGGSIDEDAWTEAVVNCPYTRLAKSDVATATSPAGQEISIVQDELDADFFDSYENEWYPLFRWRDGVVSFKYNPDIEDPEHSLFKTASELCQVLGAELLDDEGGVFLTFSQANTQKPASQKPGLFKSLLTWCGKPNR